MKKLKSDSRTIVQVEDLLAYTQADHDLIPLNRWNYIDGNGVVRGKTPRDNDWPRRDYAPGEIQAAIDRGCNVGVRMQPHQVVIDVDPRNQACPGEHERTKDMFECRDEEWHCTACGHRGMQAEEMAAEAGIDLAMYPSVHTGGRGLHCYAKKPAEVRIRERAESLPGIEFKSGRGRQVVAAGSRHPNGNYYMWDDLSPPLKDAPELQEDLLALIARPTIDPRTQSEPGQIDNEQLARLLADLDPEDFRDHEPWLELGMASHHATNGHGEDAFVEWSTSDECFADHDELIRYRWPTWAAAPGEPCVTIATLLMRVREAGGDAGWLAVDMLPDEVPELPAEAKAFEEAQQAKRKRKLERVVTLSNVTPVRVEWLWPSWIPSGMMTILTGDPAVLKTTVATDIAARITRGNPMPRCQEGGPPGHVLILACEDPIAEVVVPRMSAAGADMGRVHVRRDVWAIDQLAELDDMLQRFKPRLLYIDALFSALQNIDAHRDNEVRGPLQRMIQLATGRGATVVATRHTRKGGAPIAVHAGMASVAFSAVARSELFFAKDPDAPEGHFIMAHAKCNVGPQQRSLRYRAEAVEVEGLAGETYPRIDWLGESGYTADQLASGEAADGGLAQRRAERWLEDWLRDHGPTQPRDIWPEAREAGHSQRTLERAMDASPFIRGEGQGRARVWVFDADAPWGNAA